MSDSAGAGSRKSRYKRAVGLEYEPSRMSAPAVNVKAEALRADEMVSLARRFGVPVVENSPLARSLSALEIDQQIPADLFESVALVLSELERKLESRSRK